jgi:putative nucleotidyltransferase with HDIG domain
MASAVPVAGPLSDALAAGSTRLPSLPSMLTDALAEIDNQRTDAAAIVDRIARDPPLAARVLRIANSPFFGLPRQISSLREAVVLVGIGRVRELLLSACFSQVFPARRGSFDHARFWRHSLTTAISARRIAACAGLGEESAFTAGLLHDIGRLVAGSLFPEAFGDVLGERARHHLGMMDAERRILGADHAEIAALVADRWNFPETIRDAVARHHTAPTAESAKSLATVIHVADLLCATLERSADPAADLPEEARFALDLLDVPQAAVDALPGEIRRIAAQIATFTASRE